MAQTKSNNHNTQKQQQQQTKHKQTNNNQSQQNKAIIRPQSQTNNMKHTQTPTANHASKHFKP